MLEDSMIVELFQSRDERALVELEAKYGSFCRKLAKNILKNESDAEECVNDTYLALWNAIPPAEPSPLRPFVLRIARNISLAKYHANTSRKRNSYYDVALDELEGCLADVLTLERELESGELSKHLDRFLDSLDRESRVMFVRRYWYSESVAEIAERLETNSHRISVHLYRTREKLKKYFKKEGIEL